MLPSAGALARGGAIVTGDFFRSAVGFTAFTGRYLPKQKRDVQAGGAGESAGTFAIAEMVAQQQFQCVFTGLSDFFGVRLNLHAVPGQSRTGRNQAGETIDLHHADHARSVWPDAFEEAHRGNIDSEFPGCFEDRPAMGNINSLIVDRQVVHHATLRDAFLVKAHEIRHSHR